MQKIDVLICYEHKNRELESAARIAAILRLKGYSCEIKQLGWNEPFARLSYSPKVVVTPWCYDDSDFLKFTCYKGANSHNSFSIINLHCEQIAFNDAIDFCLPKGKAKEVFHCCWGQYFENLLLELGVDPGLIYKTGSPRLDFFRKEYTKTKEELANAYGLDCSKKWIIIVGNFSQMYWDAKRIKDLSRRGIENAEESKNLSKESFLGIYNWVKKFLDECENSSSVELIYRPHPSEQINSLLINLEKGSKSFHIISDLAIREWYANSDLSLVWSSTSSVESSYAGTPVISLRPIEIPENKRFDLIEELDQIKTYEEFEKRIVDCYLGKKQNTNQAFLNSIEFYYGRKTIDASMNTANAIDEIICEQRFLCRTANHSFYKNLFSAIRCAFKRLFINMRVGKKKKSWKTIVSDKVEPKHVEETIQKFILIEQSKNEN